VFQDVRVFDGTAVRPATTVVIQDGLITQVGPAAPGADGARPQIVSGTGKTLLPGLIDGHTHAFDVSHLRQAAVFGVTTELDMFTDHAFAARMRAEQKAGEAKDRADLLSAGTLATPPGGHGTEYGLKIPTIDAPGQAQAFVDARVAEGSDYIKIVYDDGRVFGAHRPTLDRATLGALIQAAHARHKLAVVHVLTRDQANDALAEGADGLVHIFVDRPADDALVALAAAKRAFVVPTLTVLSGGAGRSLTTDAALVPWLTPADRKALGAGFPAPPRQEGDPIKAAGRLRAAGVPLVAGTDAINPGTAHGASIHHELELLVAAGLTPAEALAAATSVPAALFGLQDRGQIAPGRRADLVLVEGDPTVDIRATRAIAGVWKQGEPIDRDAYRAGVQRQLAEEARPSATAPPPRSESGLVSSFEGERIDSAFGSGWTVSTDRFVGGQSQASLGIARGGANESKGCLRIIGTVEDRPQPRWAGALFSPGAVPMAPANLSARTAIHFRARGDGKTYSIMLFARSKGFAPAILTFAAGPDWQEHRFALKDFERADASGITGLFFGSGLDAGPFELLIDDVRFE
jgi:imidazolonepropionase-like amidohydrolase